MCVASGWPKLVSEAASISAGGTSCGIVRPWVGRFDRALNESLAAGIAFLGFPRAVNVPRDPYVIVTQPLFETSFVRPNMN